MQLGLIGKNLSHSFSKIHFDKRFSENNLTDFSYVNFDLESISDFTSILKQNPKLRGLNVTMPYKESVINYLDEISEEAKNIGAVNCIKISGKKLTGYNTDVYGFSQSIKPFLDKHHERALILGTGGASKAVAFALKKIGVEFYFVTHTEKKEKNTFYYNEINEFIMQSFKLIINTTPLGLFPQENKCPLLQYKYFSEKHLAFDLIYNPDQTQFLKQAKSFGANTVNGLSMLQLQAEKSWDIWMS